MTSRRPGHGATVAPVWVLATRNAGKGRELRALFAHAGLDVVDLAEAGCEERVEESTIECHATFEENAVAKACYFAARLPGRTVVADDSGLVVDALDGAPGVYSKRWSGRTDLDGVALDAANNARLMEALQALPDGVPSTARFVCAAAWCDGTDALVQRGEISGHIVAASAGANGFGYDPHFFAGELGMTLQDASIEAKERVSHRGRAFRALLDAVAMRSS